LEVLQLKEVAAQKGLNIINPFPLGFTSLPALRDSATLHFPSAFPLYGIPLRFICLLPYSANIQLRKVEVMSIQTVTQKFTDLKSKLVNESFTPGQIASIQGSMLKFDEADPNQGIFFIGDNGVATKVNQVVKNKPSELLFFSPEGLSGSCQIEVRTIIKGSKSIKAGRMLVDLMATV
jgi:hypothetical protein